MTDMEKVPCTCKIDGKQYDENDETCIKCKKAQKVYGILFEIAIAKAADDGDTSLLETLINNNE